MNRPWIAFFSQTGSEIVEVSKLINRWPDLIITNKRPEHLRKIHPALEGRVIFLENKPTEEDMGEVIDRYIDPLITLHGWLRIMPPGICNNYEIYNGHPGLITEYPELKGKDPQQKAFDMGLEFSGAVIHRVTEGVDEGALRLVRKVSIKGLEIDELFHILHSISVGNWVEFLNDNL
jgi:folate-dependent phosphoribosylglycinamide formyltransferase PurN